MRREETMWAVVRKPYGREQKESIYYSVYRTRSEAIKGFCRDYGADWNDRDITGLRVVRVTVSWEQPDAPRKRQK